MAHTELCPPRSATSSVFWMSGEHDIANVRWLSKELAMAAAQTDALVIDLSGVEFMDASTVGAIIGMRQQFGGRPTSFSLRAPSPLARRVLDACGLLELLDRADRVDAEP